jgi:hypothetical protein
VTREEVVMPGSKKVPARNGEKKPAVMAGENPRSSSNVEVGTCGRAATSCPPACSTECRHASRRSPSGIVVIGENGRHAGNRGLEGVGQTPEAPAVADHHAGRERPEVQRLEVEPTPSGRVAGEQDLEAAVEPVAVHDIRADPAADRVGGLEHHHLAAGRPQGQRTGQPGEPGADDDDVSIGHAHAARSSSSAASSALTSEVVGVGEAGVQQALRQDAEADVASVIPISPYSSRIAKSGMISAVGRCRTCPSALVSSRLVTGSGRRG